MSSNCYLEGRYSEVYPEKSKDEAGMLKLFRAFSFPGQLGSHCTPEVPGSIHEGGELGYSISHAFGAAFDNPYLIVSVVVGDGEAETGPLATSWHSNKFLNPIRDGAVLPILHLNGYKIANPTILARITPEELSKIFSSDTAGRHGGRGRGRPIQVMHRDDGGGCPKPASRKFTRFKKARSTGKPDRPRWPMIVLRSPKGWTGPKKVDGHRVEGFWRAHQVPVAEVKKNPEHLRIVEKWMRSYKPEELFDKHSTLIPELRELAPKGDRRMSANPHADGGKAQISYSSRFSRLCDKN
jgi:xylulose-5-phosphate/fructose-6-phosphate phosphoketolase